MKFVSAVAALFLMVGGVFADVTVTGEGKVTVEPDVVHITVGVQTQDKSAVEALKTNSVSVKDMFDVLEKAGVERKDMQTSHFSVSQLYHNNEKQELVLQGYQVVNNLTVCVRKMDSVGEVLDKLVKSGANRVGSVTYGLNDPSKVLDKARVAAVEDAKRRADLYAKTADVRLGKVVTISENVTRPSPTRMYAEAARSDVPLAAGSLTFTVTVNVVYEAR